MNFASHLFQLQKKDSRVDSIDRRMAEIQVLLSSDEALANANLALTAAEQKLAKARSALKKVEDEVQTVRIKTQTSESALYGGRIHNPKELQDIQNEIASLKRRMSALEDDQLAAMIGVEDAETNLSSARSQLDKATANNLQTNAALVGERSSLQAERDRLQVERVAVIQQIPSDLVTTYERLRKQKRGIAVAMIQDNSCSGCGSSLRPEEIQFARASQEIKYCSTCGRIIFAG